MGKIPVIDQSTNFICGFTNDESSLITTKENLEKAKNDLNKIGIDR